MTMWSDNRNHLLDDVLRDSLLVLLAQAIGVPPGQFVALVAITPAERKLPARQPALWFGRVGERLWISPRFHRLHHSVGIGHETAGKGTLGGYNFGVLLPWWDMLFRTANFEHATTPPACATRWSRGATTAGLLVAAVAGVKRLVGRA
jgi:sterol desaturase/sphingolipid hydroxylase (fatty acid hydroxylase superfamily)